MSLTKQGELVPNVIRSKFRNIINDNFTLGQIHDFFEAEGFMISRINPPAPGIRRELFDAYAQTVNWKSETKVRVVLRVFSNILNEIETEEKIRALNVLTNNGFHVDSSNRISSNLLDKLDDLPLSSLKDSAAILDHFERIRASGSSDPAQVIGSSKELVESTCKLVIERYEGTYDKKDDLPALAKNAQTLLKAHPSALGPDAKHKEAAQQVLGSLSTIVKGLAEMRNAGGTGHGRTNPTKFYERHALLALGSASTYCRFLLSTLDERVSSDKI